MVLGTPTTGTPVGRQLVGHAQRVVAADGDQGVDAEPLERRPAGVDTTVDLERVGARRAEHRAAPGQRAPHGVDVERHGLAVDDPSPPVDEAEQLVAELALALADHRPDHGVQAGAVSATGEHGYPHRRSPRGSTAPIGAHPTDAVRPHPIWLIPFAQPRLRSLGRHDRRHRHRCGHHRGSVDGVRPVGHRRRLGLPRVPAVLPPAGLGRARRRRDLALRAADPGRGRAPRSPATVAPSPPSASPTSARRRWCGTGAPAGRCTARSSGRTGAPRRAATSSGPSGHLPLVRADHRPGARPVLLGHQARVAADRGRHRGRARTWPSAPSTRGCCGTSPAAEPCTPPTSPTPAARCCSTSGRMAWSPELCDLFGVPVDDARRGAPVERAVRGHRGRHRRASAAASRSAASAATSRRRCSARPASSRA